MITSFEGKYSFLSNFFPVQIIYEDLIYNSVEHAFQAAKTLDRLERIAIQGASTPGKAKRMGNKIRKRDDWESVRDGIMKSLLVQKFNKTELRTLLLGTKDEEIIEGNNWNDTYWGAVFENGKWIGENRLGQMIMEIRNCS